VRLRATAPKNFLERNLTVIVSTNERRSPPAGRRPLADDIVASIIADPSPEAERADAHAFLAMVPAVGQVPARQPYASSRDEAFIRDWYVGATRSGIMARSKPSWYNLEDAREAIYVGRKAGYSDEDIAAYLLRNYDL